MREIKTKFRAWDKKDKRFIYDKQVFIPLRVTNVGIFKLNPSTKEETWLLIDDESRFELMQYTGLRDKKGVKIYEGDVVRAFARDDEYHNYIIQFQNGGFVVKNQYGLCAYVDIFGDYEVIGNIYETPNLCAKKKLEEE